MNADLYTIASENGITVDNIKLQKNKSLSVRIQNRDYIGIDENAMQNTADARTHLAHELGHCMTGAFYNIGADIITRRKAEYKAEKWAVLKCVPKVELSVLLKQGYSNYELAEHFGISETLIKTAIKFYYVYNIAC